MKTAVGLPPVTSAVLVGANAAGTTGLKCLPKHRYFFEFDRPLRTLLNFRDRTPSVPIDRGAKIKIKKFYTHTKLRIFTNLRYGYYIKDKHT
jgi:hypothetical protein